MNEVIEFLKNGWIEEGLIIPDMEPKLSYKWNGYHEYKVKTSSNGFHIKAKQTWNIIEIISNKWIKISEGKREVIEPTEDLEDIKKYVVYVREQKQ